MDTSKTIKILTVGQEVFLGSSKDVSAEITAVIIRDAVTYEVSWWDGLTRKSTVLRRREFKVKRGAKEGRIGFSK